MLHGRSGSVPLRLGAVEASNLVQQPLVIARQRLLDVKAALGAAINALGAQPGVVICGPSGRTGRGMMVIGPP